MDFQTAVRKGIDNITNFEGRASRPEFWWFVLAVWVGQIVAFIFIGIIFSAILNLGIVANLLYFAVWVVAVLCYLSVGIRRLHDVGQPGWMIVFAFLCCLWLIPLYFWVQPSQADNQYGPAPAS